MDLSAPAGSTAPSAAAPRSPASRAITSDFDTFLKMLTAQIRNQNPLEPMPSADFAVQLATFSTVEQQVRTNELLEQMSGPAEGGLAPVAGWVGMEARSPAGTRFTGAPIPVHVQPDPGADAAQLVVRDGTGREVERRAIPIDRPVVDWTGRSAEGAEFLHGPYSFEVVSFAGGRPIGSASGETYGLVIEARTGAAGPVLVLAGGATVPAASVSALRRPGPAG